MGRNTDVAASTIMDNPEVINEYVNNAKKIQDAIEYFEIQKFVKVGHQTDSSGSTSQTISKQVRKFFPSMVWFRGNIDVIRQEKYGNIYDILFKYGDTE